MAAHINTLSNPRMRTMVVPREHGAWGMLLVPLATGAVVGARVGVHTSALVLFICAAVSLFWLRTPVESWLGTSAIKAHTPEERALVQRTIVGVSVIAAASIALLLWNGRNRELLLIGIIAGVGFATQAAVKRVGRRGRMPAQVLGAIGLTSTAAGAYYVATGQLDRTAIALWMANWLFAGDQIHFVQLRIHSSRAETVAQKFQQGRTFLFAQIVLIGTILASCRVGLFPAAAALAFVPVLFRGTAWLVRKRQPLDVHKLGFAELGHALAFGALFCLAFMM